MSLRSSCRYDLYILVFALIYPATLTGQKNQPFKLPRLQGEVVMDGKVNEPAWNLIEPLPLVMYQPTYRGEMTEATEVRVCYDDQYLYVSGVLQDSEPDQIRSNSLYRDKYAGDDTFSIILDPYNDEENGLWFYVSPEGVRSDSEISKDAEFSAGRALNGDWNTFWDAEAYLSNEGWSAEIRIPFSSLGFQSNDELVEMGMIVYRFISRKNERHIFPDIEPNWSLGFVKPSQAQTILLENIDSEKLFYLTPYARSSFSQQAILNPSNTEYKISKNTDLQFGGNGRYNITNNLTLDVTINTDFAQVEADNQQVNLGRFSLFFPEKRQFFQERSGLFAFNISGADRVFHSRTIGLSNNGQPIPILGGARLTGRAGNWDIAILNMQTASSQSLLLPSENFGVVRLRRRIFNSFSTIGGILTSRLDTKGKYNYVMGLDGTIRVFNDEYLQFKYAQTFDDELIATEEYDFKKAGSALLQWTRRRSQGFFYDIEINHSGSDYRPDLGFITRTDFTRASSTLSYGKFYGQEGTIRILEPSLFTSIAFRNMDGTVQSAFIGAPISLEYKTGGSLFLGNRLQFESLRDTLRFSENAYIPPGEYWFYAIDPGFNGSGGKLFRPGGFFRVGTFYDGIRIDIGVDPTWNVSRHLELRADIQFNHIRIPDRNEDGNDELFNSLILRLRTVVALNRKLSATSFFQLSNVQEILAANVRIRYNFREGNDLWIVYNERFNTYRISEVGYPDLPRTDSRVVLIKYTHTFKI